MRGSSNSGGRLDCFRARPPLSATQGQGNVPTPTRVKGTVRKLFPAVALVLVAGLTSSLSADPFRPSVKDQIALGKKAKAQIAKEEKVLPDSDPRVQEVRRLGQLLVSRIPEDEKKRRPFEYTFDVIDNKELNAFAVPGGPIYFHTGLLDRLQTEDQVAGILAHEIIHVRNQHWASAYADQTKRQLGIVVILSILNAGNTAYDVAGLADAFFVGLPYSRKHENEADRVGFDLAVSGGFNPQGMVDVFRVLKEASGGKKGPGEWASTHPDTDKRINTLEARVKGAKDPYPAQKPRATGLYRPPAPPAPKP